MSGGQVGGASGGGGGGGAPSHTLRVDWPPRSGRHLGEAECITVTQAPAVKCDFYLYELSSSASAAAAAAPPPSQHPPSPLSLQRVAVFPDKPPEIKEKDGGRGRGLLTQVIQEASGEASADRRRAAKNRFVLLSRSLLPGRLVPLGPETTAAF